MRRKVSYSLLLMLLAVNCMAFNLSTDTTKTSKKVDSPLTEDGYDVDVDTAMGCYGKPIQHLISSTNNTIALSCPTPSRWKGLYTWEGFKISNLHVKMGEASFKGMNTAIPSPIAMTTSVDSITDSIFIDRLLAAECKGNRWVYSNAICNTEADAMLSFEGTTIGKEGIGLSYEGGQGHKYDYQLLINTSDGQPCLANTYVGEHNSTAKYQATHQFDFTTSDDESDFSLHRYRCHFPMLLRMGNCEVFGE